MHTIDIYEDLKDHSMIGSDGTVHEEAFLPDILSIQMVGIHYIGRMMRSYNILYILLKIEFKEVLNILWMISFVPTTKFMWIKKAENVKYL